MRPEIVEIRQKLKEILYDCAIELRATKAALYLLDTTVRKYELVVEYGFRSGVRQWAGDNDPMVDRCSRGRAAFFVNSVAAEPRISQLLFDASSERLLGVPIVSRGQMVGFLDIRDKQGKQPFDQKDASLAQGIADRILNLIAPMNLWNQRFITLMDVALPGGATAAKTESPSPAATVAVAAPAQAAQQTELLAVARAAAARLLVPFSPETLSEHEIVKVRELLRGFLLLPNAVSATFSGPGVNETATVANAKAEKVYSAPVAIGTMRGVSLAIAFSTPPDQRTRDLMSQLLDHVQTSLEYSLQTRRTQATRLQIAAKLIEPDFRQFPDLRKHCESVMERSEMFARYLALSSAEIETIKLTAMVHDVGMRLLDYDRLYRKRVLSSEEMGYLREHAQVGAALVEPLLGPEIARAVLCHHERVNGAGYPNQLRNDEIPLASRVLQICDAFVAITDPPANYQVSESDDAAISYFVRGAGTQFDKDLSARFIQMMKLQVS